MKLNDEKEKQREKHNERVGNELIDKWINKKN